MGAVPKRRISTGRKGRRRSAIRLKMPRLIPCPACRQPKLPHQACPHCGDYKKTTVIKTRSEKKAAQEKKKKS